MNATEDERTRQREAWRLASRGWRKWDFFLMEMLRPIGEQIIESSGLADGYTVLDVATGTGEPGLTAAARVSPGKVVGVDFSEEMLDIAKEKAMARHIRNYETVHQEHSVLPFEDDRFDAVICRFGVMFFPDISFGLGEMTRVLKSGKRVALSVWGPQDEREMAVQRVIGKCLQLPPLDRDTPGPFRCSEPGMIKSLLELSGLGEVKEVELRGQRRWPSPSKYWEFLTEINPRVAGALGSASEDLRKETRHRAMEALEGVKGKDDAISFNWTAWVDSGTKPRA